MVINCLCKRVILRDLFNTNRFRDLKIEELLIGSSQIDYLTFGAGCPRQEYLCFFKEKINFRACRRHITKLSSVDLIKINEKNEVKKVGSITYEGVEDEGKIFGLCACICYGYVGNNLFFVAVTGGDKGSILLYHYNLETGVFCEVVEARVPHGKESPRELHLLDGEVYYTGEQGRLMKISLEG